MDFATLIKKGAPAARQPRVLVLPPSAWADGRSDKPREDVKIGIRLLSEDDVQVCRGEAVKAALELIPQQSDDDRIAAYNDALMRMAAERGTCLPHDATQPYFTAGELEIRTRLTPEGIRRIWHEIDAYHAASNPTTPEIDDEGLAHLFALLHRDAAANLELAERKRVNRLLEVCRAALAEVDPLEQTG